MRVFKRTRNERPVVVNPPATSASRSPQTPAVRVESRALGTVVATARAAFNFVLSPILAVTRQAPGLRLTGYATGDPARPVNSAGLRLGSRLVAIAGRVTSGVSTVVSAVGASRASQRAGVRVNARAEGTTSASQKAGTNIAGRTSGTASKPQQTPGARVVRTSVVLVHESGAASVTESAGSGDWANEGNTTGKQDGTTATISGSASASRNRTLTYEYANFTDKGALTIRKVELRFFVSQSGTALNNGFLELRWGLVAVPITTLETITGDVSNLSTPRVFDITSGITSWSDLDNVRTAINFQSSIGELYSAAVDAVHLYIEADSVVNL